MRRAFGQSDRMNVSNNRFIKNILNGTTLAFDARREVRVGIRDRVKFTSGEQLGRDVMAVANARLLGGVSLQKAARLFFALTPLQVYVPLGFLKVDSQPSFPPRR